jgi:hypothetical protein
MRLTLLTAAVDGTRVSVDAVDVNGSGLWRGTAQEAGIEVDVELEVRDEIDWSKISVGQRVEAIAKEGPEALVVRGFVDDLDIHGVLTLRLAGGVLLIDTLGEPPIGVVGREVSLVARDVEIYPTNV